MQSHTITPVFVPLFLIKYGSRGKYRKEGWAHIWNVVRKHEYMDVGRKEKRRWLLVVEHAKKKRMMARKAIITQKSKLVVNVIIIIVIVSTI